jgi:hypothetical protein
MGVPMRRVDFLHYFSYLGGLLKLGTASSSDYENIWKHTETMHLFAGSVGVANSMQYLVLLPGLALVHRGELFIQSRTHMTCKDGARAERYPKRYPNETLFFFRKRPG